MSNVWKGAILQNQEGEWLTYGKFWVKRRDEAWVFTDNEIREMISRKMLDGEIMAYPGTFSWLSGFVASGENYGLDTGGKVGS